jgi:hypothetical protein
MFNYDILELLFKKLYNINDVFNFRLIDKDTNDIFKDYFKKIKIDIIPRSTFINFRECYVCYRKCDSVKQLIYKYDSLPHKSLIHCTNKLCYLSVIKRYLHDIKSNNIYPFCFIKNEDKQLFKSNNKILTNFYLDSLKKYNGKWYIKTDSDIIVKQKYIRIKNLKHLNNLNLFWWYLGRKNNKLY